MLQRFKAHRNYPAATRAASTLVLRQATVVGFRRPILEPRSVLMRLLANKTFRGVQERERFAAKSTLAFFHGCDELWGDGGPKYPILELEVHQLIVAVPGVRR